MLAANITWDQDAASGHGPASLMQATTSVLELLSTCATPDPVDGTARPCVDIDASECLPSDKDWDSVVADLLNELEPRGAQAADSAPRRRVPEVAIEVRPTQRPPAA